MKLYGQILWLVTFGMSNNIVKSKFSLALQNAMTKYLYEFCPVKYYSQIPVQVLSCEIL